MIWFTAVSDILLYFAFAVAAGAIALKFVPAGLKPEILESRSLQLAAIIGIAVFSSAPVVELVVFLGSGEGWTQSILNVLVNFRIGNGWVITVLLSILLGVTVHYKGSKRMEALYIFLLILAVGFYSHVSSVNLWGGFASHSIHFFALSLWAGVLLHVAWLSKSASNWTRFLDWFTPFAMICVGVLLGSGFVIMLFFVSFSDYEDSWVLPYGQLLLLKHLSIIPLLVAALINGLLNRGRLYERAWLRAESLLLMITLALTAFMSKEAPPHNINETFRSEGAAPFLEMLKGAQYVPIEGAFTFSVNGSLLLLISILSLGMMVLAYKQKLPASLSVLFGAGFITCAYIGLMLTIAF